MGVVCGERLQRVSERGREGDREKPKRRRGNTKKKKPSHQRVGEVDKDVALGPAGVGADLGGLAHLLLKLSSHTVVLLDAQRK